MSQCTDVDAVIKRLEGKIDSQNKLIANQNKQIADLQKKQADCCGNGSNKNDNNNNDLARRVARIEMYINALDATGREIQKGFDDIKKLFTGG